MDKKIALVRLLRSSLLLSDAAKLAILDKVESMTSREVDELGEFLVLERKFVLDNEAFITANTTSLIDALEKSDKQVYVGSGKPN